LLFLLVLSACTSDNGATDFVAFFNPSGQVPFPNNVLFDGSTDGTLNIADPPDPALNSLDGFSTVARLTARFSQPVDESTLTGGTTVRIFEVDIVNPFLTPNPATPFAVSGVVAELAPTIDYEVKLNSLDFIRRTVEILPMRPLKPKTGYLVVMTDGIKSITGTHASPSEAYRNARDDQATALGRQVTSQEDTAAAQGINKENIVLTWTFLTQSIDDVLVQVRNATTPQIGGIISTLLTTTVVGGQGLADIYIGTLQIPYYLNNAPPAPNPPLERSTLPLQGFWADGNGNIVTRYNPIPVFTQTRTIPLLLTVPNLLPQPASGWPVVIFQHGSFRNRLDLLAIADALASAGFVGVAIDLPLHGVTDTTQAPFFDEPNERTFNLDLVNNITLQSPPDDMIDTPPAISGNPSGFWFFNVASVLTSRDNVRQAVSDLFHLTAMLKANTLNTSGIQLDTRNIRFVGHSLGTIVGTDFLALEGGVSAATLANPGGGILQLLANSPNLSPLLNILILRDLGFVVGTPKYEDFIWAAQAVIDAADSINYAQAAANPITGHPIHVIEVLGDQTIPNSVSGAPLSGGEPLARIMNLAPIDMTTFDPAGIHGIVRFTAGIHGSFIDPLSGPAVTREMQSEMASFMGSDVQGVSPGTLIQIADPSVVQQVE
jgi:Dienelactone hydrolase and related enzymes